MTIRLSDDMYHATYAVFAYWWEPPDGRQECGPREFVGVLPPPWLYAERLALTLTERPPTGDSPLCRA